MWQGLQKSLYNHGAIKPFPPRLRIKEVEGRRNFSLLRYGELLFNLGFMTETHPLTTTAFELPGYRVTKSFGVVRGIIVRSRSVIGNFGAQIQSIFGGNITIYTNLCEQARKEAFEQMLQHAGQLGANAVIGVRYDATELMPGITEVLCYGTAVSVEPQAR